MKCFPFSFQAPVVVLEPPAPVLTAPQVIPIKKESDKQKEKEKAKKEEKIEEPELKEPTKEEIKESLVCMFSELV